MNIDPNVKVKSVERIKGGFRICGEVDADGAGNPIPPFPVCVVVRDSFLRRAARAVRDEGRRFAKKVAEWFKRERK